ncbi:putative colanic acid biosynthesis acetyltransferase [Parabacteroides goldsteinii]|jgi:putative colanic acid biosynthesis acetyltransferase WcaF|uniref:putative colanic acid biosynthesis acetyltransferase n=1 Tax=Parabacteroides goldsteinii TaxID=328812 RepID=UPI001D820A46|nr:putative colanic acid biosynthesis acetyltransferase [Parabacteroides goldsteinii]MBS6577469.1 putative colanic acid biosynthesis acetyltransferase [Parabacteroides goldsteinii]
MYQNLKLYKYNLKRERSLFFIQWYNLCDSLLIKTSPKIFHSWRNFIYRLFGAKIGYSVRICSSTKILYPWNVEIGDFCWIGDNCNLYSVAKIRMGNNVALAHNVFLATASHDLRSETFETLAAPIIIEDEAWLSSNVFVNCGVTIHRGAAIGSCSLVTKDLPEGYICVGIPAKPIKQRNI